MISRRRMAIDSLVDLRIDFEKRYVEYYEDNQYSEMYYDAFKNVEIISKALICMSDYDFDRIYPGTFKITILGYTSKPVEKIKEIKHE